MEEVKLILDNGEATVKNAVFDSVGDLERGDNDLVINNEIVISALSDGGYAYGFGTVSDGILHREKIIPSNLQRKAHSGNDIVSATS